MLKEVAFPKLDARRPVHSGDEKDMIQRFDQLAVDLPEPDGPNPTAAAAFRN